MTPSSNQLSTPLTELYRPRRYADTIQGLDGWLVSEMVAQERAKDYTATIAIIAAMGLGKTTLARLRGARRGCVNLIEGSVEPCGHCNHCRLTFAGMNAHMGAYHEIDCGEAGWLDEVNEFVHGSFPYRGVLGRTDHFLQKIIVLDELQRAAKSVQQGILKKVENSRRIQFIICSTDRDAILPELLNRCLELKIEKPTAQQYATWLKRILRAEGISWDDGVIGDLDRGTNRGIRTTLVAIRPLARTESHITKEKVRRHFGMPSDQTRW